MPRLDQGVLVAMALGVSAEFLVTGKVAAGLTNESLNIAYAAERLSSTGKYEALHLIRSLEDLHPADTGKKGIGKKEDLRKTATG